MDGEPAMKAELDAIGFDDVIPEGDGWWVLWRVPTCGPDEEQHDLVHEDSCSISERLDGLGLVLTDAYHEHDCISGLVVRKPSR